MKTKITSDDVRTFLTDQESEITGCADDLGYITGVLKTIAHTVEAYTEAKCQENTCMPDDIEAVISGIQSVIKRLESAI